MEAEAQFEKNMNKELLQQIYGENQKMPKKRQTRMSEEKKVRNFMRIKNRPSIEINTPRKNFNTNFEIYFEEIENILS